MKIFQRKLNPNQKAAIFKLADGIECGAALRPQAMEILFEKIVTQDGKTTFASCALGAAWECAMIERHGAEKAAEMILEAAKGESDISTEGILRRYGVTTKATMLRIELDGETLTYPTHTLAGLIIRLNDTFKWSREQIAQFLREVE